MTKSFFTHLSTIFLIHAVLLMGTLHLSQSDFVRTQIGTGVLKLQVATSVLMNSSQVQKKIQRVVPLNPLKPQVTPKVEEKVVSLPVPAFAEAGGSEFGTSANGKSDSLSMYKAELRATIDKNKYYPILSRRLGQAGIVVIAFTLLEDGNIVNVRIDKPSQYERLNASALDAVKKVQRFKPIPKEIGETRMDIKVPVKFVTI